MIRPTQSVFPFILLLVAFCSAQSNEEFTADDIVAKHLAALGPAAQRIKTREVRAHITVSAISGGVGQSEGEAVIVSDRHKLRYQMDFGNERYRGEQFVFDGAQPYVAEYQPGKLSMFANFMRATSDLLSEGLFGGSLTTGWALLDLSSRNPKVRYDGVKTVEGKRLHQVSYHFGHGPNDADVKLYFELGTYRHVYSRYAVTLAAGLGEKVHTGIEDPGPFAQATGGPEIRAARQNVTRLLVEERFSNFVSFDGVTLPTHWDVNFTSDRDRTIAVHWAAQAYRIENDPELPPEAFALRPLPADYFPAPKRAGESR